MIAFETLGRALLLAAGLALATGVAAQQATPAPKAAKAAKPAAKAAAKPAPPELEAKAMDILKAMSAKLAGAKAMSFTAIITYESPSRLGPPLSYTTISDVVMQRPDKLRVITPGRRPGVRVLLRRQGNDGIRAGGEPGRRRRRRHRRSMPR